MDPELVAKRRSTVFQRIQFELTKGEVIQKRLSPGKFPTSTVGIIKILSMLLMLSAAIAFLSNRSCPDTADWYPWLFPLSTCLGAIVIIIFYAVFTFGLVLKYPAFWFISDITSCLVLLIFIIVISILTMQECQLNDPAYKVPGALGVCSVLLLLISGAGLYIMYRNKEDISVKSVANQAAPSVGARRQKINNPLDENDYEA